MRRIGVVNAYFYYFICSGKGLEFFLTLMIYFYFIIFLVNGIFLTRINENFTFVTKFMYCKLYMLKLFMYDMYWNLVLRVVSRDATRIRPAEYSAYIRPICRIFVFGQYAEYSYSAEIILTIR